MKKLLFLYIFLISTHLYSFQFEPIPEYLTIEDIKKVISYDWKSLDLLPSELSGNNTNHILFLRFRLPEELKDDYCIYYFSTEQFYKVYIDNPTKKNEIFTHYYGELIPKKLSLTTGESVCLIPLKSEYRGKYIYFKIFFANKNLFLKHKRLLVLPIKEGYRLIIEDGMFSFILGIIGVFFGLSFIVLSFVGGYDWKAFWGAGVFFFFISLRQFSESLIPLFYIPYPFLWGYLAYYSGFFMMFGIYVFLNQILLNKYEKLFRILIFSQIGIIILAIILDVFLNLPLSTYLIYYFSFLIIVVILLFFLITFSALAGINECKILFSGGVILFAIALYELISRAFGFLNWNKSLLSLGILFFILSMVGILFYRFILLLNEKEKYFKELVIKNDENLKVKEELKLLLSEKDSELKKVINKLKISDYLMKKELELARRIQMYLIPKIPPMKELSFFYKPMEEVCGDFYDFIEISKDKIGIFISDVSGHGVPAAFITSMLKTAINQMKDEAKNPARFLTKLNDFLYNQVEGQFVTAFYCIYNKTNKKLLFANAGHISPLMISEKGIDRFSIKNRGLPLGILESSELEKIDKGYKNKEIKLKKGSKIFLFTDGLSEAFKINRHSSQDFQESFGETSLEKVVLELASLSPDQFINKLYSKFVEFRGVNLFEDDICMICFDVI